MLSAAAASRKAKTNTRTSGIPCDGFRKSLTTPAIPSRLPADTCGVSSITGPLQRWKPLHGRFRPLSHPEKSVLYVPNELAHRRDRRLSSCGLTPAKVQLEADVTNLVADSTDLSRIIGSIRDASGKCVWSSAPIVFTVEGPADVFEGNPVTENAIAGKIGIIVKSKNSPGIITISATSTGLTPATLTLTSAAADISALPFIWNGSAVEYRAREAMAGNTYSMQQTRRSIVLAFSSPNIAMDNISLVNMQGRMVTCQVQRKGPLVFMNTGAVARGVYRLLVRTQDRVSSQT